MLIFYYHTQRTIEIVARDEEEADQLVQAELHYGETVISMERDTDNG